MVPRRPPRSLPLDCPAGRGKHRAAADGMVCPLIYLIIIGGCADLYSVRRGGGIWYRWRASGRVYVLQRGADGIIAAFVGLVSWSVERVQLQEKPL